MVSDMHVGMLSECALAVQATSASKYSPCALPEMSAHRGAVVGSDRYSNYTHQSEIPRQCYAFWKHKKTQFRVEGEEGATNHPIQKSAHQGLLVLMDTKHDCDGH